MSHNRLMSHFDKLGLPAAFNHFDYVEAFQQLPDLDVQAHPKKRKLAEECASRCLGKLEAEEKLAARAEKSRNFIERMRVHESIRQQKLEALRFIEDRFDSKSGQLRYYPKVNSRLATQKGRFWKDRDGFEAIEREPAINPPNSSSFSDYYTIND
jgi:hypothetical protein